MELKFRKKFNVGFSDMDINYRLTKISAAKFFQETFALYCAKNNVAAFDICDKNLVWVISDLSMEFSDIMPYWSDEFEVEIWISEKTPLKMFTDFRIYHHNKEIAKGDGCWYLLDKTSRRPVKITETLQHLEVFDEKVFGKHEKKIYKTDGEKFAEKEHIVTVKDLDFNYHVNNLSYMEMALEAVPTELLKKYNASYACVKFVREAYLDDILVCELYQKENTVTARIYNKKDSSDICFLFAKYNDKKDFGRNPREAGISF